MKEKMIVIATNKHDGITDKYTVMEIKYKISDNVLWITDHRNRIIDFDLNEYDVEIMMAEKENEDEKLLGQIEELKRLRIQLLERVDDYEDTYRMSGHPSICNRISELHEVIGFIQERVYELSPSDCDW